MKLTFEQHAKLKNSISAKIHDIENFSLLKYDTLSFLRLVNNWRLETHIIIHDTMILKLKNAKNTLKKKSVTLKINYSSYYRLLMNAI